MSLKGDKYETVDEVKFRLEGTVVLYDGAPVLINQVSMPEMDDAKEIARVYFLPLPLVNRPAKRGEENPKAVRKYLSSRRFDLTPFPMGYFNHEGEATFVSRTAARQNKQGLSANVCRFLDVQGKGSQTVNWNQAITAPGFVSMINGVYPSFLEAGEALDQKDTKSVAVSRSFAFLIDHDLEALLLLHKGVKCGITLRDQKAIKIPPKFHFLKEELEECRIPLF